jgi:hypothetical protein
MAGSVRVRRLAAAICSLFTGITCAEVSEGLAVGDAVSTVADAAGMAVSFR